MRQPFVTPWLLLAGVAGGGAAIVGSGPLGDPDVTWHVELGRELVAARSLDGAGRSWSFAQSDPSWTTTQWLSEVLLFSLQDLVGWSGVVVVRWVLAVAVIIATACLLLRRDRPVWGAVLFTLTVMTLAPYLQERPQLASLPLLLLLARAADRARSTQRVPRLWPWAAITFLWANLHGLWVLVPAVFALLAACARLDRRAGLPSAQVRPLLLRAATCTVAGSLTPAGPGLLLAPMRVAEASTHLIEWQRSRPWSIAAAVLDIAVILVVLAWTRRSDQIPPGEMLYVGALIAFGFAAQRNIGPTIVLLAPILASRATRTLPFGGSPTSCRERRVLASLTAGVWAAALVVSAGRLAVGPTFDASVPERLARLAAAEPAPVTVLNDYNTGGALVHWGRNRVQVLIDGRADYYGEEGVSSYLRLVAARPGWQERLAALDPDLALLDKDVALTDQLRRLGWTEISSDSAYVLLRRPTKASPAG